MSQEHSLFQRRVIEEELNLEITETPSGREMLALPANDSPHIVKSKRKRIKCSCGQKFNKDETAIDHLYEVGEIK
jgi:acetone carboxylase gamma subunit